LWLCGSKYIGVKRRSIELMQRAFAQYPEEEG
jgi:hypothetical protein